MPPGFPNPFIWSATPINVKMASQVLEFLVPVLQEAGPDDTILQQGVPPPFPKEETDLFHRTFAEKQTSKGSPKTWPPNSPDLTYPWLFFRCYIKDAVYVPALAASLPELAGRVRDAVATVSLDLHKNVCTETGYRYICRATHGAFTEDQLNWGHINVIKLTNQIRLIFFLCFLFHEQYYNKMADI
jgi:hypothetical protein